MTEIEMKYDFHFSRKKIQGIIHFKHYIADN